MSYNDLELKIVRWAEERLIVQNSNPLAQAKKSLEEAGELVEAASALEALKAAGCPKDAPIYLEWREKYTDALGDVLVTLIVGAATADVALLECLDQAHQEIKDRKGFLRHDGVFVKVQS